MTKTIISIALLALVSLGAYSKDFDVRDFGAVPDGMTDCSVAFRKAVQKCSAAKDSRVVVPEGTWFHRGPLVLESDVELHICEGAEVVFSHDQDDYLPMVLTRWEGTECWNWSPLVHARGVKNISITGKGTLNGSGSKNFATWKPRQKKDQKELRRMGTEQVPVDARRFGPGHWLRPAFFEVIACENVVLEDVTFVDSPFWVIHPIECDNVVVKGVRVHSYNQNNDGCDPESCSNVLIENCVFETGDDGIAIKSGRDNDGWRMGRPTEKVVVRNCTFRSKANGVCIGSEISGGVRDVYIENVRMSNVQNGIYFKSNLDRGGFIHDIRVRGVKADTVRRSLILFDPDYKSESKEHYPTAFRGFKIEDVQASFVGKSAIDVSGFEDMPVSDVSISDVTVGYSPEPVIVNNALNVDLRDISVNGEDWTRIAPSASVNLDGEWYVTISDNMPDRYEATVKVPGLISQARPSLGDDLDANDPGTRIDYDYVWYRHRFKLEMPDYPKAVLKLRAKYNAKVYLNGKEIGYDHHCAYSHASFDISDAIRYNGENELVVRVGSWNTSSYPSKDNSAEWWRNSRAPGIWDDVRIDFSGDVSVVQMSVLPDVRKTEVVCNVDVDNSLIAKEMVLQARIMDEGAVISSETSDVMVNEGKNSFSVTLPADALVCWSAGKEGNPKLYDLHISLYDRDGVLQAVKKERFGYRQIETHGRDVLLNGKKVIFRAENVAFTRAVNRWADACFDEGWIRNFLRSAVRDYNLNYLRIHLGHAYSKWYDIADEEGIMLQDEWRFMHDAEPVGKDLEETETEFRRWVMENINHPSIVAWDQENEGGVRLEALKSELRTMDPTRLWAEDDYIAKHIYEYSENIVTDFDGYSISDEKPSTVLESCRLWTNEFGEFEKRENFKTSRTASGWNIFFYTPEDAARLLADLHADIGTFYRSRRIQAWAPFALLSGCVNGHNFFVGDITDSLVPQKNLKVLARLNEPLGASFEMLQCREWYKDKVCYTPGGKYSGKLWVWNDYPENVEVEAVWFIVTPSGKRILCGTSETMVKGGSSVCIDTPFTLPRREGIYKLACELRLADGSIIPGVERRLMVTGNVDKVLETEAFGGRRTYSDKAISILENFSLTTIPSDVQRKIIATLEGSLVDKVKIRGNGDDRIYTVQSTVYESSQKLHITTAVFDSEGNLKQSETATAQPFISLPEPVRKTIVSQIGAVPEDESRIVCRPSGLGTRYDISMVGTDIKHMLTIADDGTIIKKEMASKK